MPTYRVLILDDDDGNRMLLLVALQSLGFAVEGVGTGAAALAKARETDYDVALVDVNLPDMNGLDVAAQIRQLHAETAIIIATIDDDDGTLRRARECCNAFVIKPFDLDVFLDFMRTLDPVALRTSGQLRMVDNISTGRFH